MKKYRVKLENDRIIGPFKKERIGELFLKGHINGSEEFQDYPAGDWGKINDFDDIKKLLKKVITHKDEILNNQSESTIARIKVSSDVEPSEPETPKKVQSNIKVDDNFNEFQYSKKTSTKINYKDLEDKYQNKPNEDPKEESEIEKTKVVRLKDIKIQSDTIDKTVVLDINRVRKEEEEKKKQEELVKAKEPEEKVDEVKEEVVDKNESTSFIDLKSLMPQIRKDVEEAEKELVPELPPVSEKEDENFEEEEITPVQNDKRKKIFIVIALLLIGFLLFDSEEAQKSFAPIYAHFEFPRTSEKRDLEKSKNFYIQGMKLYSTDSYINRIKASSNFLKAVNYNYDNYAAFGMLVKAYAELLPEAEDQKKAKRTIYRLIQLSQNKLLKDPNLSLGVATFYSYLEKFPSARRVIEDYLRLNKETLDLFTYYLYVLIETGDYVKAKKVYQRLERFKAKTPETYYYMAMFLRANEDFQGQRNLLEKAVELKPKSVKLWLALCDNLFVDGEYALLKKSLDKIKLLKMEYSPHYYSRYLEYRGMLRALNGNLEEAVQLLKKALTYKESNALRSKLAALELNGSQSVQTLIQESKIKDYMRKSKEALDKKKWKDAFQFAIEAVDLNDSYIPSQLLLSNIQNQRGYYKSALGTTRLLKKQYPANPDVAFAFIDSLMHAERMDEANRVINQLSNSTKFFQLSKFQGLIGQYWLKKTNFKVALKYFQMALKKDPLNDDYYYILATEFFKRKRFKSANRYLSKCLELDPNNIYYMSLQSHILYEMDGPTQAIGYLRDVLKEYPDHPKLLGDIAIYYYKSGENAQFKRYKKRIEALHNKDGDFFEFMIKASLVEENEDKIIEYSKKLIQVDPGNIKARLSLGEYLLKRNKNLEALAEFKEISERLETYPRIHYNMARVYINLKNFDLALKSALEEIKQNPSLPYGHYIAGEVYRLQEQYAKATPYFEAAISKNYRLVPALMGLGYIKYRNNLYEQARQFYLKAQKEDPNNPEIHKQLGYIFNASGQSSLAVESFQTYLELSPMAADKTKIERFIRALR